MSIQRAAQNEQHKAEAELLAAFMGSTFEIQTLFEDTPEIDTCDIRVWSRPDFIGNREYNLFGTHSYRSADYMQYRVSWEWLMPVVEKIESLGYDVSIDGDTCTIYDCQDDDFNKIFPDGDSKLEATYNAVVIFIKWYNEQ